MGYFQYPTLCSVNCCVSDNKAAALIPGATHDHRAATERPPESADEIGSAARRGRRCGWRPSMMNEAADVRHGCRCFPLVFVCAKKSGASRKPFIHFTRGPLRTHFPLSTLPSQDPIESSFSGLFRAGPICHTNYVEKMRPCHGRRQYDGRIFAMQHRRACICGHGTGGGGPVTPPLGTCTHR